MNGGTPARRCQHTSRRPGAARPSSTTCHHLGRCAAAGTLPEDESIVEWSTPHLPPFSSNAQLRVLCNASTLASSSASTRGLLWHPSTGRKHFSLRHLCACDDLLIHHSCPSCSTRRSKLNRLCCSLQHRSTKVRATLPSSVPQHICLVALVIAATSLVATRVAKLARVPQCAVLFVVLLIPSGKRSPTQGLGPAHPPHTRTLGGRRTREGGLWKALQH